MFLVHVLFVIGGGCFLIGGGGADNPTQTLFFARVKKQICGTSGILRNRHNIAVFINLTINIQKWERQRNNGILSSPKR